MFQYILTGVMFGFGAITDIRQRIVSKKMVGIYFLLAVLGHGISREVPLAEILAGILPGGICLCFSCVAKEALGYGDSILILVSGISLGIGPCMELLIWGFFFSGVWALLLLVRRRIDRKTEIPFVPFLLIGLGVTILV